MGRFCRAATDLLRLLTEHYGRYSGESAEIDSQPFHGGQRKENQDELEARTPAASCAEPTGPEDGEVAGVPFRSAPRKRTACVQSFTSLPPPETHPFDSHAQR